MPTVGSAASASFLSWSFSEPTGPYQRFDQLAGTGCVYGTTKRTNADILDRHPALGGSLRPQPAEDFTRLGMTFGEANLTKGCPGVWPEVVPHQPNGCGHKTGLNLSRLWPRGYLAGRSSRPVQVRQGASEPQHMPRRFRKPLPLPPIETDLFLMNKLSKLLKLSQGIVCQWDVLDNEPTLFERREINQPDE